MTVIPISIVPRTRVLTIDEIITVREYLTKRYGIALSTFPHLT